MDIIFLKGNHKYIPIPDGAGNDFKSKIYYDQKYNQEDYYWGFQPSAMCYKVL